MNFNAESGGGEDYEKMRMERWSVFYSHVTDLLDFLEVKSQLIELKAAAGDPRWNLATKRWTDVDKRRRP